MLFWFSEITTSAAGSERTAGLPPAPGWKTSASLSFRESFDTNVFLQDDLPAPAVVGAAQARRASLLTTAGVALGLERRFDPDLAFAVSYATEANFYHSAPAENHQMHKLSAGASGQIGPAIWSLQNNTTWTNGSEVGPVFGGVGGVAAMGGIPLRDRRAAWLGRSTFKFTRHWDAWFVRPLATLYIHDFETAQSVRAGYANYIDRREMLGGVDFGLKLTGALRWVAGYRLVRQDQFKLHGVDSPYDSTLQRFLVGLEGTPTPWLQLTVLAGPETRRFAPGTAAGFDPDQMVPWIDAVAVLTPSPRDACIMTVRRFEQPAFASCSVYEDITYEISWRRKCSHALTLSAGCKLYGGDWPTPVNREDWILTPSAQLQYAVNRHGTFEVSYAFDEAKSRVPATAGREYRRHLGSVATKFNF